MTPDPPFWGSRALLIQGDRLSRAARLLVGEGKISAGGQGVGVVGAQGALANNLGP